MGSDKPDFRPDMDFILLFLGLVFFSKGNQVAKQEKQKKKRMKSMSGLKSGLSLPDFRPDMDFILLFLRFVFFRRETK